MFQLVVSLLCSFVSLQGLCSLHFTNANTIALAVTYSAVLCYKSGVCIDFFPSLVREKCNCGFFVHVHRICSFLMFLAELLLDIIKGSFYALVKHL